MLDAGPTDDGRALRVRCLSADRETPTTIADPDGAFAALGYGPAALDVALSAGLVTRTADGATASAVRPPS